MITKFRHTPYNKYDTKKRRFTVAGVLDEKTNMMHFGIAVCRSGDNFCRAQGRELAERRALNKPDQIHSQPVSPEHLPKLSKVFNHVAVQLEFAKDNEIEARLEIKKRRK